MAYQSLYRRYRPRRFAEVRGQDHLVRALRNAVVEGRVGHAYLLSGPRGTGKTSTARILAKVLNCAKPDDGEPCCVCESCLAIDAGTSFDLHELDAASNRGVDDIRDLIDKTALGTPGRQKIYILDEVHMLTPAASNALLKTLEEPPAHVIFVLATTDPQKVLPTIRSRTQHFDLGLLTADEIELLVRDVATDAELDVNDEQVAYVVRTSGGSARDALSALEQVTAAGGVPSTLDGASGVVEALIDRDAGAVLIAVHQEVSAGRDPRVLGEQLLDGLRNAFLSVMGADLSNLSDVDRERAADVGSRMGARPITLALEALGEALVEMRQAPDARIPLEVALVKVARPESELSLEGLADRLDRLERSVRSGEPPAEATPGGKAPRTKGSPARGAQDRSEQKGGPADGARQALAQTKGGGKRASSTPAGEGQTPEMSAEASSAAPNEPTTKAPHGPPTRPALGAHRARPASTAHETEGSAALAPRVVDESVGDGAVPTRDELTLAWGDVILDRLDPAARTRFKDGRFLRVEGLNAVFALPSVIHVERAGPRVGDVQTILGEHFDTRLTIELVVDDESRPPPDEVVRLAPPPDDNPAEDVGPVDELRNASDLEATHLERISQAFPGAELVDDDPES
jgi:DNA polymerase-3 subunit gamma/tau